MIDRLAASDPALVKSMQQVLRQPLLVGKNLVRYRFATQCAVDAFRIVFFAVNLLFRIMPIGHVAL